MTKEYKASTKTGQKYLEMARRNIGYKLTDVYDRVGETNRIAYDWCFEQYCNTHESHDFHICSASSWNFTVAWEGIYAGERVVRMETRDNTYIIYLDR